MSPFNKNSATNTTVSSVKTDSAYASSLQKISLKLKDWLKELLFIILIIVGIIAWQQKDMLLADGSVVIPNAKFVSLDGITQDLLASDKPTLLYFFAPWCKVCELSINNVDGFEPAKLHVMKVALAYSSREEIETFVAKTGTQRNIIFGSNELQKQFAVTAFPSVYILESDGTIVGRSVGYTTRLGYKLRIAFGTE